jgi:8-oxo-dGTP diphosphatase
MIHYCVGFAFYYDNNSVALIKKNRPAWQAGKMNGIGGKLELDETPVEAMIREFREETGHEITDWKDLCTLHGNDFVVSVFVSYDNDHPELLKTMTDEMIDIVDIYVVNDNCCESWFISNLPWLVNLALDPDFKMGRIDPPIINYNK